MGRLYFLIGLARSGKSTLARRWLNKEIDFPCINRLTPHIGVNQPRVIVCRDQIRLALGHRYNGFVEDFVAATATAMTRALLIDHDVLLDETHTTASNIKKAFQIDPMAIWYHVNTDASVCKERAVATGQEDLVPVIDRMMKNLLELTHRGVLLTCVEQIREEVMQTPIQSLRIV
jgi:hypothetical protein